MSHQGPPWGGVLGTLAVFLLGSGRETREEEGTEASLEWVCPGQERLQGSRMLALTGHLEGPREEGQKWETQTSLWSQETKGASFLPGDLGFPLAPREGWITTSF